MTLLHPRVHASRPSTVLGMLHAPTFADVERRLDIIGREQPQPLGERLVSILFALPTAFVMDDLGQNRAYYDVATCDAWDLFVAGYYAFGSEGDPDQFDLRTPTEQPWAFSPNRFLRFQREVEQASEKRWRFSGEADLVSFMSYQSQPDWETLRAVNLRTGQTSLGEVVEGLRLWRSDEVDERFAPGTTGLMDFRPASFLVPALAWSASAVAAEVLGDKAAALVQHLMS